MGSFLFCFVLFLQHLGDELQRGLAPLPERLFVYEFEILQTLCGLLIGRFGAFVNQIRVKTGASLIIKKHPTNKRHKLCAIEGTPLRCTTRILFGIGSLSQGHLEPP